MSDTINAILSAHSGEIAIFSDFDGTLVEIAPRPDAVAVPGHLPLRLERLYDVLDGAFAVITGRTIAEIDVFLPDQVFSVTGSHGAEQRHQGAVRALDPHVVKRAEHLARLVGAALDSESGVLIEAKPTGVAIHYRAAPDKQETARNALESALAGFSDFHAVDGKKVIEARPRTADKGSALKALMKVEPFLGRIPVFIGDDVTDEDGFAAAQDLGGFGIKIGLGPTGARFRLPDTEAVYAYFDALIADASSLAEKASTRKEAKESLVK